MTPGQPFPDPVHAWLRGAADDLGDPMAGFDHLVATIAVTPQRRPWWSARSSAWGHRRPLAVGALLAAGALAGLVALQGMLPRTIVVAQDGSGDARTIGAGVGMARSGDTVLIRPGTYQEMVTISEDITVAGDGPRGSVLWEAVAEDSFGGDPPSRALSIQDGSLATIRGITIVGHADGTAVTVSGGAAPIIEDVTLEVAGPWTGMNASIAWSKGSGGTLRNSRVSGNIFVANAGTSPLIEHNELWNTCITIHKDGGTWADPPRPVIRWNQAVGCATGVAIQFESGLPVIEHNNLVMTGGIAVSLAGVAGATVRDNTIHGSAKGLIVANPRGPVVVAGNIVSGNTIGIGLFGRGEGVRLEDNDLRDNRVGLTVASQEDPMLAGNTVCGNGVALKVVPADRVLPSAGWTAGCPGTSNPLADEDGRNPGPAGT